MKGFIGEQEEVSFSFFAVILNPPSTSQTNFTHVAAFFGC